MYANYFQVSLDYIVKLNNNKNKTSSVELNKIIIGKRIKKIRIKYNISQRELARILNTTNSTIWAYENGKTLILTEFAYQLCKHFNVSLDYLCGRIKEPNLLIKN